MRGVLSDLVFPDTPHAIMELALAHTVGSAVERAYARSDLWAKRRAWMQRWAEYVTVDRAGVVKRHG